MRFGWLVWFFRVSCVLWVFVYAIVSMIFLIWLLVFIWVCVVGVLVSGKVWFIIGFSVFVLICGYIVCDSLFVISVLNVVLCGCSVELVSVSCCCMMLKIGIVVVVLFCIVIDMWWLFFVRYCRLCGR